MAELRLEVLMEAERTGLTVTEICKRYGISRQTYYRYRRRYLAEGLPGLQDRSRRILRTRSQPSWRCGSFRCVRVIPAGGHDVSVPN
ncbi:MAG: helix-turn-helix domain-containing protein [Actinobacteria bacterium]|nr:helix-turn-helix domain-containing protein [Actinomycetota bacterium]